MKKYFMFLLIAVSVLVLFDLVKPGTPATHDGPDHVARIANFYLSLSEGNIVPRWAANLNWGYGHPILMFLYPAPSYLASLFHAVGFSFVDSTKLVFAGAYLASVIAFYLWASRQWNKEAGFVGALLYGFAPYRFVDLYVRGALGEHVAFVFPPLIFLGLLELARGKNKWARILLIISTSALILSHNAISMMVLPVVFLYGTYVWFFESKKRTGFIIESLISLALGFVLSAFFWIPALFEGKYTLRNIVTKGEFTDRFVPVWQFFVMPWSYGGSTQLTKEVGVLHWIGVVGAFFYAWIVKDKKYRWFTLSFFGVFIATLACMTSTTAIFWNRIMILQNFQFPWRFLTVTVLVSSMLGSVFVSRVKARYMTLICIVVLLGSLFLTRHMWHARGYLPNTDEYYSGIYNSTTDTGESSPIWSVRFMEHRAPNPAGVIEGVARITPVKRSSTRHTYMIESEQKTRIVEHTLYFPGWRVLVDGKPVDIEFQDPTYRGLMTYWVESGTHEVLVEFGDTKLRFISTVLTVCGLVAFVLWSRVPFMKRSL